MKNGKKEEETENKDYLEIYSVLSSGSSGSFG